VARANLHTRLTRAVRTPAADLAGSEAVQPALRCGGGDTVWAEATTVMDGVLTR